MVVAAGAVLHRRRPAELGLRMMSVSSRDSLVGSSSPGRLMISVSERSRLSKLRAVSIA